MSENAALISGLFGLTSLIAGLFCRDLTRAVTAGVAVGLGYAIAIVGFWVQAGTVEAFGTFGGGIFLATAIGLLLMNTIIGHAVRGVVVWLYRRIRGTPGAAGR